MSKQTYGIMRKIAQVDTLLSREISLQLSFRETHPEICFWSLNNYKVLNSRKKEKEGVNERLELLKGFSKNAHAFYDRMRTRRDLKLGKDVKSDDILDAMAAALTASLSEQFILKTLPEVPEVDSFGLKMEIVYVAID